MQNHLSKPEDLMLQNATPLRKSAPSPPNSSDEDVSCTAPATEMHLCRFLQMSHACHRFWTCHKTLMFCSLLTRCTIPCACHAKREPLLWLLSLCLAQGYLSTPLATNCYSTSSPGQAQVLACSRGFHSSLS